MKTSTNGAMVDDGLGEIIDRRRGGPQPGQPFTERRTRSNRRQAPRYKTFKGGRVVWPDGEFVECIIRNLSETGAGLEVHSPVPETFELVFDADQSRRRCRVMWQKPMRIGVQFE